MNGLNACDFSMRTIMCVIIFQTKEAFYKSLLLSLTTTKISKFIPKATVMTLPVFMIIISLGLLLLLICMLIIEMDSGRKAIHNYIAAIKLMMLIKHLYGDVWDKSCDNEVTITPL